MLNYLLGLFSHDLAIDLGTANTLVYVKDKGIVIFEPSVVARHKKSKQILAVGTEAKQMLGKTPATIEAFRPLKNGVIADFDATEAMLSYYIRKVHENPGSLIPKIPKPRVVIGIPSGVTEVERRAVQESALEAGARQAYLVEEPMAAAIGAKLPLHGSKGSMIVDIGGGTTEIAVIALGGLVVNRSIRVAGDELDDAIINFLRLKYSLLIGYQTAEHIKIDIGSAYPGKAHARTNVHSRTAYGFMPKPPFHADEETEIPAAHGERHAVVRGRDLETGLPKTVRLTESEIREALSPVVSQIIASIQEVIEETPPELLPDILESGMAVTGGGSLLTNIDLAIAEQSKMPVWLVEDPLTSVVRGCAHLLEDEALLKRLRVTGGLKS